MIQISSIEQILPSCALTDIIIFTDQEWIQVSISAGGSELLGGRFYSINGEVHIRDVRSLVELRLSAIGESSESFTIEAWNSEQTSQNDNFDHTDFIAVYCDRNRAEWEFMPFLLSNFLTAASSRRIPSNGFVFLPVFADIGETLQLKVYANHNAGHCEFTLGSPIVAPAFQIYTFSIFAPLILEKAQQCAGEAVSLQAFTVQCGTRAATFYIDPSLDSRHRFFFRNTFNAPDVIFLHGETTTKTTSEHSTAILIDSTLHYNTRLKQEFEVVSNGLTTEECRIAEQLLTSHDVRTPFQGNEEDADFDAMQRILVTDYTCEINDRSEKPNTVRFTWRYAKNGVALNPAHNSGIFTSPFNFVFR